MEDSTDFRSRYLAILSALHQEHGWRLSPEQQDAYVAALLKRHAKDNSDLVLRTQLEYYHREHQFVESLLDHTHPEHNTRWKEWANISIRILQRSGLAWTYDVAVSPDDLIQTALMALIESLPRYRYESRFSTWAYTVVVRSVARYLKSLPNASRHMQLLSLDEQLDGGEFFLEETSEYPETIVEERELWALILRLLQQHSDPRRARMVQLRAQDKRLVDIGHEFGLHPARVSVLLHEAYEYLRHHPELRAWQNDEDDMPS